MNTKSLTVMGVIAAVFVGAAVVVSMQQEHGASSSTGQRMFPGLLATVNDVTELRVTSKSGAVTVLRQGESWRVTEKHLYPADVGKIRETLIGLAELTILETKTAKPERHEKLGVRDVDAEGSSSTGVTLTDAEGGILANIIVGRRKPVGGAAGQQEVFVRKPGNPQTWLAVGNIAVAVASDPDAWLDKDVLHLTTKRVRRVSVTHPDGSRLELEKAQPDDLDYHVANLPDGRDVDSQFAVNNIVSTLTSLSFDDVRPASEVDVSMDAAVVATLETFDGFEGTVAVLERDEKYYVTVSAAFKDALVRRPEPDVDGPADEQASPEPDDMNADATDTTDAEPPAIKPAAEVTAEVDALNRMTADWVYVIPSFRAETILKKPADLTKPSDES